MAGVFVVFEGIDGSGKSTTIAAVAKRLEGLGHSCVALREPTEKTDASREIRRILRTVKEIDEKISNDLLDLFLIDRLWDLKNLILPALFAGKIVLLDRYFFSTAAYQSMQPNEVNAIIESYLANTKVQLPDLVIHLDLPVKTALARIGSRANLDVFENEARLTRIAENYRKVFQILQEKRPTLPVDVFLNELVTTDFESLSARIHKLVLAASA